MTNQPRSTSDLRHPWTRRQLLEGFAATFAAASALGALRSPAFAAPAAAATAAAADASGLPSELWRAGAGQLAEAIAKKRVSSLEVIEAHLARIQAVNPKLDAMPVVFADEARAAAKAADAAIARGDQARSPPRRALLHQGQPRSGRQGEHRRHRREQRQGGEARRAGGRAHEGGRRHSDRPHQPARPGAPRPQLQRALGTLPQPLEPEAQRRRIERRRSRGARHRHEPDRPRQRHRRLAAQPGQLLRHRGAQAVVRAHPARGRRRQRRRRRPAHGGQRTDGAHDRRRPPRLPDPRRPARARPVVDAGAARPARSGGPDPRRAGGRAERRQDAPGRRRRRAQGGQGARRCRLPGRRDRAAAAGGSLRHLARLPRQRALPGDGLLQAGDVGRGVQVPRADHEPLPVQGARRLRGIAGRAPRPRQRVVGVLHPLPAGGRPGVHAAAVRGRLRRRRRRSGVGRDEPASRRGLGQPARAAVGRAAGGGRGWPADGRAGDRRPLPRGPRRSMARPRSRRRWA